MKKQLGGWAIQVLCMYYGSDGTRPQGAATAGQSDDVRVSIYTVTPQVRNPGTNRRSAASGKNSSNQVHGDM